MLAKVNALKCKGVPLDALTQSNLSPIHQGYRWSDQQRYLTAYDQAFQYVNTLDETRCTTTLLLVPLPVSYPGCKRRTVPKNQYFQVCIGLISPNSGVLTGLAVQATTFTSIVGPITPSTILYIFGPDGYGSESNYVRYITDCFTNHLSMCKSMVQENAGEQHNRTLQYFANLLYFFGAVATCPVEPKDRKKQNTLV